MYTVFRFEWDPDKNRGNARKHGISFEEAQTVFEDDNAALIFDPDDGGEERFLLLGMSAKLRLLIICHCIQESDSVIRIISTRKANRAERLVYEEKLP